MRELEPNKETIGRGELLCLWHPGTENTFSGYGLTVESNQKNHLVGILMVDRPKPVDSTWLNNVATNYGPFQLVPMTATGERGIVCQMKITPESQKQLRQLQGGMTSGIKQAIQPLLDELPNPVFILSWDEDRRAWVSDFAPKNALPPEIREVFKNSGYGCLAAESEVGIVHICHASDTDISGFWNKSILTQWQLIKMPTAPLIRLELLILDKNENPFKFESFLNLADEEQAQLLAKLASQEHLYLAFYGDDLTHRYTITLPHDERQWQQLDMLIMAAEMHWQRIDPERYDFDRAKAEFIGRFSLNLNL